MQKKVPIERSINRIAVHSLYFIQSYQCLFLNKKEGSQDPLVFFLTTDKLHPPPLESVIIFLVLWIISKRIKYNEGLLLQTQIL